MDIALQGITKSFDYLLKPFRVFPPFVGLCVISAISGIILLKLYGLTSNQQKIRQAKDLIKAHLLGLVHYKDDMRISLSMQAKMLLANFRYFRTSLLPFAVLLVVCIPILGQLNARYGYQPFAVGDDIQVFVKISDKRFLNNTSLRVGEGLKIITPALRIDKLNEVDWKIQALNPGTHKIDIRVAGENYSKEIVVAAKAENLTPIRPKSFLLSILYPGEDLLPSKSKVESIEVAYLSGSVQMFGYHFHWLLVFCIVSIISGLAFKRILKVEI